MPNEGEFTVITTNPITKYPLLHIFICGVFSLILLLIFSITSLMAFASQCQFPILGKVPLHPSHLLPPPPPSTTVLQLPLPLRLGWGLTCELGTLPSQSKVSLLYNRTWIPLPSASVPFTFWESEWSYLWENYRIGTNNPWYLPTHRCGFLSSSCLLLTSTSFNSIF